MTDSPQNPNHEITSDNSEQQENTLTVSNVALEVSSSITPSEKIYIASSDGKLRQGEILSNIIQVKIKVESLRTGNIEATQILHPFAVVISQDCDCEQDFNCRKNNVISDKILPSILFCEVMTAEELRGYKDIKSDIWKQVKINKNERYQFLEKVPTEDDILGEGLPELGLDFKRYFTVPTDEVYYRIETGEVKRRCRLISPYMEHLSARFSHFLHRIALPNDHASE
ncbi:MAG: hypothetical protein H0U27_05390 [Nitrosopumilus sp.]|nr:hypothetical protein [Nitrosopumilus sp.]